MTIVDPLAGAWELPKRLRDWGEKFSPPLDNPWMSQINFERTPDEFMSVARLLLPEFIVHQGGVFLRSQFTEASFDQWFVELKNLTAVERMLNHVHVYDVFGNADNATEEEFLQVAKLLHRTWDFSLSKVFPEHQFDVDIYNSEQDYGPTITFSKRL